MLEATIGAKYQVVIPKAVRKKVKGIIPGAKVAIYENKGEISLYPKSKLEGWVERTRGIAKEAWKDIDPIAELEKMRNEW